ncbi:MAG: DUF2807 domain-containing protein [Sphingobium sp.]|nr:DUF2807 domain-containing protein [Sphingobium sp.]
MGDRTRLFLTGVAAAGAIAMAFSPPWTWFDGGDDEQARAVPLSSLKNFDGIKLDGPDTVVVTSGPDFSVSAEGDPQAVKHVSLAVHDGVLRVQRRKINGWWGSGGHAVTIRVTMPNLSRVWITGSGDLQAKTIDSREFAARLDGSGGLKVANVRSNAVRLSLNGSGTMELSGQTGEVSAVLVGSGGVQAAGLEARTADISVTGSGEIHVQARQSANLALSGSGHAQVDGTSRCRIRKTGSGEAECTS